jgi:hypothetical protein
VLNKAISVSSNNNSNSNSTQKSKLDSIFLSNSILFSKDKNQEKIKLVNINQYKDDENLSLQNKLPQRKDDINSANINSDSTKVSENDKDNLIEKEKDKEKYESDIEKQLQSLHYIQQSMISNRLLTNYKFLFYFVCYCFSNNHEE